ncbi:chitinase [Erysiphe neolycopersici]|uniref:Chitinase n=1 Tax=Erysiphe neolycopersici TaxID=212602 RepID=A0A420I5X9_9PEZI|nr:chitinase [Erysiphe neolycopersici]
MPPLSPPPSLPRLVIYHQTHHYDDGTPRSVLPLITQPNISVTHVIIAAIHLHNPPENIKLPSHSRNRTLWAEVRKLQYIGIKILGMLGGAAKGSFARLDRDEASFELYYKPLQDFIKEKNLDGLDLDVEEEISLSSIIRLIDRLKADFGEDFLITLAPVATALIFEEPKYNLSGFSYEALDVMRGNKIAWYNTQFYCGWGDMSNTNAFDQIIAHGYNANKIVIGLITNPKNGSGWVSPDVLQGVLIKLKIKYPNFGGIMGWEYFNSLPGGSEAPWEWAANMTRYIRSDLATDSAQIYAMLRSFEQSANSKVDSHLENEAPKPNSFEYISDNDEV